MHKAVFIDKDGTLVVDRPYDVDPAKIALMPGAAEALRAISRAGYLLFVISNQPGLALGRFSERDLRRYLDRLHWLLGAHGVFPTSYYCCPHHPVGTVAAWQVRCDCRKPRAGLLRQATTDYRIDTTRSWMIGDILDDVEAGHRAGCRSILIDVGNETEWREGKGRRPELIAASFEDAARFVLASPSRAQARAA